MLTILNLLWQVAFLGVLWRVLRKFRGEGNYRRGRDYEWERAKQSVRHIALFVIVGCALGLALGGVWVPEWFSETVWSLAK